MSEELFEDPVQGPRVHNGTYTVSHPESGHFTVKLYTVTTATSDLCGKRLLALLVGPNNEVDFQGVAFWDDDELTCQVWKRFRGPDSRMRVDSMHYQERGWSSTEKKLSIWADLAVRGSTEAKHGSRWPEGYRLDHEGRCVACNRKLTHPDSIRSGIGPECASKAR